MKRITVFTPTYNRAYCLGYLYQSLCDQSCKDFIWLIVDDGSSDNTRELVYEWISEGLVSIEYIYKDNGGMHTAHNVAYRNIKTELNVCIDSDDRMASEAICSILNKWDSVKCNEQVAGMVGLDVDLQGNIIGTNLPENIGPVKFHQLYQKFKVRGDKKIVLRTDLLSKYPAYPEYNGERLVPLTYLYYEIDQTYSYYCFNEVWAVVDYQNDGSSSTIDLQYFKSPFGFRFAKINEYRQSSSLWYKIKALIHCGFTSIIVKDYGFILRSPNPVLSFFLFPISFLVYLYKKRKANSIIYSK